MSGPNPIEMERELLAAGFTIRPVGCRLLRHWQVLSPINRGQYPDGWARSREQARSARPTVRSLACFTPPAIATTNRRPKCAPLATFCFSWRRSF